jgi:hypothetical protein
MQHALTLEELATRLKNYPHDQYLYIGGFMRAIALAAGTIVLLHLVVNSRKDWPLLLPWCGSLLATTVTLMTWGRGILLTNSQATIWDTLLPLGMGILEFCLFAVLSPTQCIIPGYNHEDYSVGNLKRWNYWFCFSAIHAALAIALVHNRIVNTHIDQDFAAPLRPLAGEYVQWMKADMMGATKGTVMLLVSGIAVLLLRRRFRRFAYAVAAVSTSIISIIYISVICDAERQRARTDEVAFSVSP